MKVPAVHCREKLRPIVALQHEPYTIHVPIGSMYGIFTYIWLIFMVNVGKYTIHG